MLSLGSSGSWIGSLSAGRLSELPTLRTPKPVSGSQPGLLDVARAEADGLDDAVGREIGPRRAHPRDRGRDHRRAEARARQRLVAVLGAVGVERGRDRGQDVDARARSGRSRRWRWRTRALLSCGVVAATVTTCGSEAGNSSGLPLSNSLPAAATGMIPLATAK